MRLILRLTVEILHPTNVAAAQRVTQCVAKAAVALRRIIVMECVSALIGIEGNVFIPTLSSMVRRFFKRFNQSPKAGSPPFEILLMTVFPDSSGIPTSDAFSQNLWDGVPGRFPATLKCHISLPFS